MSALAVSVLVAGCRGVQAPPDAGADAAACGCDDGVYCNGVELCAPGSPMADARGCVGGVAPCALGCNEELDLCDECLGNTDRDSDGFVAVACGGSDCDDSDANRFPGNVEICDGGHDEDCDPTTLGPHDYDGDGATSVVCCNGDTCGDDCDDSRANVGPAMSEVCDGRDNDCDGELDEGVGVPSYPDADHDLYGDDSVPAVLRCPGTLGFSHVPGDCDDGEVLRHPGAPEICDGLDNDCDAGTSDGAVVDWYVDADADGYGDPASTPIPSCAPIAGRSFLPLDCDDQAGGVRPGAAELCNGVDDNCDGALPAGEDDDADGALGCATGATLDCDDHDASTYVGASELCNGVDDDCDGLVDEGEPQETTYYADPDGDGHAGAGAETRVACARPAGFAARLGDCGANDASVHPGATERCNGRDDDCDGQVDERVSGTIGYVDADGDGAGSAVVQLGCGGPLAARPDDCDDRDSLAFPGAAELCDGVDNDCDTRTDEDVVARAVYADADGDGYGAAGPMSGTSCARGVAGAVVLGDCLDDDANAFPGAPELSDGVDNDCDGAVDEAPLTLSWWPDSDGDGFGDEGATPMSSSAPIGGRVPRAGDCNDSAPSIHADALELCDGFDQDCDTVVDEGANADCSQLGTQGECAAGFCTLSACYADYDDCDTDLLVCESDLSSERAHCGACGASCGTGDACVNRTCARSPVVALAVGYDVACAARQNGSGACWGGCVAAQLGDGSNTTSRAVASPLVGSGFTSLCSANTASCAVADGSVVCWGVDGFGELGQGSVGAPPQNTPTAITLAGGGFVAVDCLSSSVCALDAEGQVWCWGYGAFDQLGREDVTSSGTPTVLPDVASASLIEAGGDHVCAVVGAQRQLVCWGSNTLGQLGDPGFALGQSSAAPRTVSGMTAVVSVAASSFHTCAVRTDGSLWCWGGVGGTCPGQAWCGVLGNGGSPSGSVTPVQVGGVSDFAAVSAGYNHFCARRQNGQLLCWGANANGEAVPGGATPVTTPTLVQTGVAHAEAGREGTCTVDLGNVVRCWGVNDCHQRGPSDDNPTLAAELIPGYP